MVMYEHFWVDTCQVCFFIAKLACFREGEYNLDNIADRGTHLFTI